MTLFLLFFMKKSVVALELNGKTDTAVLVSAVTTLWNCINIKNKRWLGPLLNDKKGEPSSSIDDPRFKKMLKLAEQFKHMNGSESTYSGCVICLASDTSNVLNVTLTGHLSLIKLLLNHGFSCVFPENF